jgi:NADH-quinone oxidoreductase subunit L
MFFAAGIGAYQAAMFHLFTNAFFKALLFLGAGSVIHGMHHEQDMRKMGALWKLLPVTYAVMVIGTLAITGFGIPEVKLGFAGFYSKDMIIEAAFAAGQENGIAYFAYVIGILAAALTAYYSWRLAFMTFHGTAKWADDDHAHDDHAHAPAHTESHGASATSDAHDDGHHHAHTPHESPLIMLVPLLLLAVGAVGAGIAFVGPFVGYDQAEFWQGAIYTAPTNHVLEHAHHVPRWVLYSPLVASMLGLAVAFYVYVLREGLGARMAAKEGPIWSFLYNKWFFDELYNATFVRAARGLGDLFWKVGDQKIIDGLGPNGVAAVSAVIGRRTGKLQTGYVYHYAFVMLLGVAGLLAFALWFWRA